MEKNMGRRSRTYPSKQVKLSLIENQDGRCAYCNESLVGQKVTWDHFIPHSWTMTNHDENWVAACWSCNSIKSNRYLASEADLTAFCLEMIKLHGSLGEGRPEGFQSLISAI